MMYYKLEELHGLADGLAIPFLKAATLFGGYNIPKIPTLTIGLFVQPSVIKELPNTFQDRGLTQRFFIFLSQIKSWL
ncbi:hypothetical protein [Virgibacillus salexigens]|uniref:hypothetical protein n=1 Tax=Virgibacillus salexigens TaxID=61016 RepID=UPI00190CBF9A|nr:hypothetical protein [Virgibacillus salexigens]